MLAGTVLSAVTGGLAGLAYSMTQHHGVMQALISYQAGGLLAVAGFVGLVRLQVQRQNQIAAD